MGNYCFEILKNDFLKIILFENVIYVYVFYIVGWNGNEKLWVGFFFFVAFIVYFYGGGCYKVLREFNKYRFVVYERGGKRCKKF